MNACTIHSGRDLPDAMLAELARLREVERVARDFCARCERGEIRSVSTYARFRAALATSDDDTRAPGDPAEPSRTIARRP